MEPVVSRAAGPVLVTKDLCVTFGARGRTVTAVSGLSYELFSGKTLAVIGESGSGKTVACRALTGLLPSSATAGGSVRFEGKELLGLDEAQMRRIRGAGVAMVFQDPARSLNPTMRIGEQIVEALRLHEGLRGRAARGRAVELLRLLQIPSAEEKFLAFPHQLSGGMRQRVLIAAAIACRPTVLVADEITASLDVITHRRIMELLIDLQRELGMALILVTHDLALAASVADDVLVMHAGRTVEHAPAKRLLGDPQMPYTKALLGAGRGAARPPSGAAWCAAELSPGGDVVLEVRNLVQRFAEPGALRKGRAVDVISDVSFAVRAGETLGLVGESGAGKSTLARTLLQIPPPRSGSVVLLERDLTVMKGRRLVEHRRHMQMIFQDPFGSLDPKWRAAEIVEEPLIGCGIRDRRERRRRVAEVLELVGLPVAAYGRRFPRELSGGQCQRVAIARALAVNPALIICDEAVSALDAIVRAQILELFERLRRHLRLSYLFISHDLGVVREMSDRVAVLHGGRLCEIGPADEVCREPRHPYSAALLDDDAAFLPGAEPRCVPARANEPHGAAAEHGCHLRDSCARAQELCARERPRLRAVHGEHRVACHFPLAGARLRPVELRGTSPHNAIDGVNSGARHLALGSAMDERDGIAHQPAPGPGASALLVGQPDRRRPATE